MSSFRVVQTAPGDGNFKQLRVEDALAYLDRVRCCLRAGALVLQWLKRCDK